MGHVRFLFRHVPRARYRGDNDDDDDIRRFRVAALLLVVVLRSRDSRDDFGGRSQRRLFAMYHSYNAQKFQKQQQQQQQQQFNLGDRQRPQRPAAGSHFSLCASDSLKGPTNTHTHRAHACTLVNTNGRPCRAEQIISYYSLIRLLYRTLALRRCALPSLKSMRVVDHDLDERTAAQQLSWFLLLSIENASEKRSSRASRRLQLPCLSRIRAPFNK
jgi:hypothetical protein